MKIVAASTLTLLLLFAMSSGVQAQFRMDTSRVNQVAKTDTSASDTGKWHMKKSPTLALVLSAVIPGAGQVYCDQWWKVPIIYAGFGTMLYAALLQNSRFIYISDSVVNQTNRGDLSDAARYASAREFYRDDRDKYYIYSALFYIANLIDAVISAHLYDFDVSDEPTQGSTQPAATPPPTSAPSKFAKSLFDPGDQHLKLNFHYHF